MARLARGTTSSIEIWCSYSSVRPSVKHVSRLREIAEHYGDYEQKEAEVLAISTDELDPLRQLAQNLALPFPVLSDSDGTVTDLYLKSPEPTAEKTSHVAIFVADRWGALFSNKSIEIDHDLSVEAEVREWLEFIELQCEECFPSEWPR